MPRKPRAPPEGSIIGPLLALVVEIAVLVWSFLAFSLVMFVRGE